MVKLSPPLKNEKKNPKKNSVSVFESGHLPGAVCLVGWPAQADMQQAVVCAQGRLPSAVLAAPSRFDGAVGLFLLPSCEEARLCFPLGARKTSQPWGRATLGRALLLQEEAMFFLLTQALGGTSLSEEAPLSYCSCAALQNEPFCVVLPHLMP